ncbi:predicted protein [Streptomyces viridochromogenes DSM 40736]|uniref:Predicted protein n=1 Tax=Streptomyces viridochromogenes (strain DSM 40736 / JCM 4977 / BCRC 1201 / Tue 494) TaxID=591159 RepID=D9XEH9_STRVT|nr:hypothetical protein [Streptomyces viridochromogenes]EFL34767.1 predicted protein [Streptomyces viridochromogenes DSM 40736]
MTTTRLTGCDRTMLRLMNDRRDAAWYATAARRRLAVAAHITLTVAIGGLAVGHEDLRAVQSWTAPPHRRSSP